MGNYSVGAKMKIKYIRSVGVIRVLEKLRVVILLLLMSALTACATNSAVNNSRPVVDQPVQQRLPPQNTTDRVVVDGTVLPLPQERTIASYSLPERQPVSSVVSDLMKKAQSQSQAGDFDSAANSLERALRIEPRNAKLWNRLAGVRYSQESWQKAIQLAAKSNTLSGQNKSLRRENWHLMSNSHKALGNVDAEQKYRNKLNRQAQSPGIR